MTSTAERYARATQSSHLEVKRHEEAPGDVDTIIAAGMAEPLGIMLARLKCEWDAAAGEIAVAKRNASRLNEARKSAVDASRIDGAKPFDAEAFDKAAAGEALTSRLLILMNLRSLEPARVALVDFAMCQGGRKALPDQSAKPRAELRALTEKLGQQLTTEERQATIAAHLAKVREVSDAAAAHRRRVEVLVGKVLDAWLDTICHDCEGRGFTGGMGKPQAICKTCKGSGHRRQPELSKVFAEHQFGLWLMNVMDSKIAGSMGEMARKTRRA